MASRKSEWPRGTNIVVVGPTAAGKTTHARYLAHELGYTYISATEIMLEVLGDGESPDDNRLWADRYEEIEAKRNSENIDLVLDERLVDLATQERQLIIDARALPWLTDAPLLRIWLDSDSTSCAMKCAVSHVARNCENPLTDDDVEDARRLVERKDEDTRERLRSLYTFDYFSGVDTFDIVLDNSSLIRTATWDAADRGIAAFQPFFRAAVEQAFGDDRPLDVLRMQLPDLTETLVRRLTRDHP